MIRAAAPATPTDGGSEHEALWRLATAPGPEGPRVHALARVRHHATLGDVPRLGALAGTAGGQGPLAVMAARALGEVVARHPGVPAPAAALARVARAPCDAAHVPAASHHAAAALRAYVGPPHIGELVSQACTHHYPLLAGMAGDEIAARLRRAPSLRGLSDALAQVMAAGASDELRARATVALATYGDRRTLGRILALQASERRLPGSRLHPAIVEGLAALLRRFPDLGLARRALGEYAGNGTSVGALAARALRETPQPSDAEDLIDADAWVLLPAPASRPPCTGSASALISPPPRRRRHGW